MPSGQPYRAGRSDTGPTGGPLCFEVVAEGHPGAISDGTRCLHVGNCIEPYICSLERKLKQLGYAVNKRHFYA